MVCIGAVAGAHGVRGNVRIKPFTEVPEDVAAYGPVSDADGARVYDIQLVGEAKGVVVARMTGVKDRDAAEALKGLRLYVPREQLPDADEDEFYHSDLIGLNVLSEKCDPLGTVLAMHDFGAGDLLEIRLNSERTVLLPFTRAVVPVVDLDAGAVTLGVDPESDDWADKGKPEGEG